MSKPESLNESVAWPPEWEKLWEMHSCDGLMDYETFTRLALFDPGVGYYTAARKRVGKSKEADFYTASCHTEVFPELMAAAVRKLCREASLEPESWVEIGAETGQDLWASADLLCEQRLSYPLGSEWVIPRSSVVYSNEVLDAQPFQRWVAQDGNWKPLSLGRDADGGIVETLCDRPLTPGECQVLKHLPEAPMVGYHLDLSWESRCLVDHLASIDWNGLFIAIDYGRTWQQLAEETPQGTARAFRNHRQEPCLFRDPGVVDLTTDVCWDWVSDALKDNGFTEISLSTMSRFLLTHASDAIAGIASGPETLLGRRKGQLLELLSPGFFGHRFQVMTAVRR